MLYDHLARFVCHLASSYANAKELKPQIEIYHEIETYYNTKNLNIIG